MARISGIPYVHCRRCSLAAPTPVVPCVDGCAGAEEIRLHEETRKQNEMLGQIEDGLGTLMQGARVRLVRCCCPNGAMRGRHPALVQGVGVRPRCAA